jgi:hypothetical protein
LEHGSVQESGEEGCGKYNTISLKLRRLQAQKRKLLQEMDAQENAGTAKLNDLREARIVVEMEISETEASRQDAALSAKDFRRIDMSLRRAREKIKDEMPALAHHLEAFVYTIGNSYVYRPDRKILWQIQGWDK